MEKIKLGLVYTSTTPELIATVEKEIKNEINGELISYEDPTILTETRDAGFVTKKAAARLVELYMKAVKDDVDAIINLCSSVGEVADASQQLANYIGVPIVRVDEEMCKEAVRLGNRIGVMATLPTTLAPTVGTVNRLARKLGKHVEIEEILVEGAFGLAQDEFKKLMLKYATEAKNKIDVILFAQGSMAYCQEYISNELGLTVLSSPKFGAKALKAALIERGIICD